jgi:hypothetical protein
MEGNLFRFCVEWRLLLVILNRFKSFIHFSPSLKSSSLNAPMLFHSFGEKFELASLTF